MSCFFGFNRKVMFERICRVGVATAICACQAAVAQTASLTKDEALRMLSYKKTSAGCLVVVIPWQVSGATEGTTTFNYQRPPNLDVEKLSDKQLEECGLYPRADFKTRDRFRDAQDWVSANKNQLNAYQAPPWERTITLVPGSGGPKRRSIWDEFSALASHVIPLAAWPQQSDPNFSGREILEAVSKRGRDDCLWGRQPGQIVICQGCDTFDENLDVDPDYPAAA